MHERVFQLPLPLPLPLPYFAPTLKVVALVRIAGLIWVLLLSVLSLSVMCEFIIDRWVDLSASSQVFGPPESEDTH